MNNCQFGGLYITDMQPTPYIVHILILLYRSVTNTCWIHLSPDYSSFHTYSTIFNYNAIMYYSLIPHCVQYCDGGCSRVQHSKDLLHWQWNPLDWLPTWPWWSVHKCCRAGVQQCYHTRQAIYDAWYKVYTLGTVWHSIDPSHPLIANLHHSVVCYRLNIDSCHFSQ